MIFPQLKGKDGGKSIGRISKQWSGLLKEAFTDADNFGIQFPLDMDVKMKAVLMGACFLIVSFIIVNEMIESTLFSEFTQAKYTNVLKYFGGSDLHVHNAGFDSCSLVFVGFYILRKSGRL